MVGVEGKKGVTGTYRLAMRAQFNSDDEALA
jgi:hypothetical protein